MRPITRELGCIGDRNTNYRSNACPEGKSNSSLVHGITIVRPRSGAPPRSVMNSRRLPKAKDHEAIIAEPGAGSEAVHRQ